MKLLFDQDLAPGLIGLLADIYADSNHVYRLSLGEASDLEVWTVAQRQGYTIVTQDADFGELSSLLGFPPKVIWIRRGNCSTREIEAILRSHLAEIKALEQDPNQAVLVLL